MLTMFRILRTSFRSLCVSTVAALMGTLCLVVMTAQSTAAQGLPSISINDISINELDTGVQPLVRFTLTLSSASQQPISVLATAQPGTAGDQDFAAGSLTINFAPGQTSQILDVGVRGDDLVEGTEQFFVNLSNPVNATIGDGQGIGTIIDDDALILLAETNTTRGAAIDSVLFTRDPLPIVNDLNFSSDHRTRVMVFAIGLKLAAGETKSAVTATAEDSQGTIRPLDVEFVGVVPNFDWLKQVVLKLNDQITLTGDVKIRITLHGVTSNAVPVAVKPQ